MDVLRIGVAGFGSGRGGGMVDVGRKLTGGRMAAAAAYDPSDARFEQACGLFDAAPARYDSVRAMVEAEPLDGFIISSPNACHLENLRELEGKRIPLILEKPLEATWDGICEVVRFCRAYDAPVLVGHPLRYTPVLRKAKTLLEQGAVGRIVSARFVQNCEYGNGMFHNWRRERAKSGTMMLEKATHDLDVLQWILGTRTAEVFASCRRVAFGGDKPNDLRCKDCDEAVTCPESHVNRTHRRRSGYHLPAGDELCCFAAAADCPDDEICLLRLASGQHAVYIQTFFTPASYRGRVYTVVGDAGILEVDLGTCADERVGLAVYPRFGNVHDVERHVFDPMERGHHEGDAGLMRHFYDVMRGKAEPHTTVTQAFLVEAAGYAAVRSSEEGRPVTVEELIPADLRDVLDETLFA